MNANYVACAIHVAGLPVLTAYTVRRLFHGAATQVSAAFLLMWANLAYTALLLSLFSQLGNKWLYLGTSLMIAAATLGLVFRRPVEPLSLTREDASSAISRPQRIFAIFLIATLGVAAACTLIVCLRYYPNNWDTLANRLARICFYLSHRNLFHFAAYSDFRALTYPLNCAILYLFPGTYQLDGRLWNLVSFGCWGMAALGVYLLARVAGASRLGALVAGWLCAMAPIVLCEGASSNDDVISVVPMLLGVAFGYGAIQRWNRRSAILAGIGLGLGLGAKLHWAFYIPVGVILVVFAGAYALRHLTVFGARSVKWKSRLPGLSVAACIAAPLAISFLVCNYLADGRFLHPGLSRDTLNRPFRLDVARQKIWLNSAQALLSPIPDLEIHLDPVARHHTYEEFDQWTNRHWFQNVDQSPAFRMTFYWFRGIADPYGDWYFEQTMWLGFLPVLMAIFVVAGMFLRPYPAGMSVFFLLFAAWHLSFAAQTKYMETIGAYYSYPGVLACAGFGLAWDALQRRKGILQRVLVGCIGAVILTHLVFDFNLLAFNVQRNVPTALRSGFDGESGVTQLAEPAVRAIRSAERIHIPYMHWEVLYWNFMHRNLGAIYTTGADLRTGDSRTLNLISVFIGQFLIGRFPAAASTGLTYLGGEWNGYVFGEGANVEQQNPGASHYFVIRTDISRKPADQSISKLKLYTDSITGLENEPNVEFRFASRSATGRQWTSPWLIKHSGIHTLELPLGDQWTEVILETRSIQGNGEVSVVTQTNYPFSTSHYQEPK